MKEEELQKLRKISGSLHDIRNEMGEYISKNELKELDKQLEEIHSLIEKARTEETMEEGYASGARFTTTD